MYVPELDRIVLKDACGQRPFANTQTNRKAVITTRVLGLVHELCQKRIHVTKRDLFYTHPPAAARRLARVRSRGRPVACAPWETLQPELCAFGNAPA